MKKIFVLLLMIFASLMYAKADGLERFQFGIYGDFNINMHSPDFLLLDDPPVIFVENKTSPGFDMGAIGKYKLNDMFWISGKLGYNLMGTTLEGEFGDELDVSLSYFEFTPALEVYNLFPVKDIYLLGGLEFAAPISKEAEYYDPTLDALVIGDIDDASARLALAIGAGYRYEVSENVFLNPELSFRLPFTQVSSHEAFDSWTVPQIRLGVSLTFGFKDDKTPEEVHGLEAGFKGVYYYDKEREKKDIERIRVEELNYGELFPVVPYVFFEPESKVPSNKSQTLDMAVETGGFSMKELEPNAVEINRHTLDIIGSRMKEHKNTNITITGTIAGKEEEGNMQLAQERAEFAKDYLTMNYDIDESRIKVKSAKKPSKPSTYRVPEGIAENRRIEIEGTDLLLEPIMIDKETRTVPSPEIVLFEPFANTSDIITHWDLSVYQSDRLLHKEEGQGTPHEVTWNIAPNELSSNRIPVDYVLTVRTKQGKEIKKSGTIPVDYFSQQMLQSDKRANKTITKFSLVVFPFDSPEVSEYDKNVLKNKVIPAINYNSTVQIYGYTDKIGDADYNEKLALNRAENVKKYLESKMPDVKYEVYGVGEKVEIFPNDNPVGRHLSRTVQIYVITPNE